MASYEIVYILSPSINEDELSGVIRGVGDIIQKVGGTVTEIIQWGRKKMAYPIKKHSEGIYVLAKVVLPTTSVKELDAALNLSGEVLRHLIVKLDE